MAKRRSLTVCYACWGWKPREENEAIYEDRNGDPRAHRKGCPLGKAEIIDELEATACRSAMEMHRLFGTDKEGPP